jgi:hypothetical protein
MAAAVIVAAAIMAAVIMAAADIIVDFMAAAIGVAVATGAAGDAGIGGTGFGTHTVCNQVLFVTKPISVVTSIAIVTLGVAVGRPLFPCDANRFHSNPILARSSSNCLNANTI